MGVTRRGIVMGATGLSLALALGGCGAGTSMAPDAMQGMDHSAMEMAAEEGDGLAASYEGYTLTALRAPAGARKPGTLSFQIRGPGGVQREYALESTKLMHTYIVREDLTNYQHVHPDLDSKTGRWTVPLTVTAPGPYRVVAEFSALTPEREIADRRLGKSFVVPGKYKPVTFTHTQGESTVGGYAVSINGDPAVGGSDLTLRISRDGVGVSDLEPYLASFAHITGFRKGDLKVVHVHPNEMPDAGAPSPRGGPELTLMQMFAEPGTYRLFVQFQTAGKIRIAPVDLDVRAMAA